jgi:HEAT repeat protein
LLATFHDVIRGAVPQIVDLLKDKDLSIQSAGANAIGKLAEHCK